MAAAWKTRVVATAFCFAYGAGAVAAGGLPPSVEKCFDNRVTHSGTRDGRDLGSGITSHVFAHFGHGAGGRSLIVQDCGSGNRISATLYFFQEAWLSDSGIEVSGDSTAEVMSVFEGVVGLGVPFDMALFQRTLREMGTPYSEGPHTYETCECAVAYPELRGDKTPYWTKDD